MIEIIEMEQKPVTDQEVVEAVNTIRRYCNYRYCDYRYCEDCAIRSVCEEYFDRSDAYPDDWPNLEVSNG